MFGEDAVVSIFKAGFNLIGDIVDGNNRRDIAINESNNQAIVKGLGMILTAGVSVYGIKKFSESGNDKKLLK